MEIEDWSRIYKESKGKQKNLLKLLAYRIIYHPRALNLIICRTNDYYDDDDEERTVFEESFVQEYETNRKHTNERKEKKSLALFFPFNSFVSLLQSFFLLFFYSTILLYALGKNGDYGWQSITVQYIINDVFGTQNIYTPLHTSHYIVTIVVVVVVGY